ncbi:TIGR03759 family integrating conjugative element protein [Pantoea rodasii]|uniref:TIGR03759 family integrating conjugative element protein n=1 Tax=Pantoea rodasii TaxID=1076549 RepID=A0A2M9W9J6_9GAMM|nr:TIGR03759 family integrating conjugative element protein [Pantoea rodasii]ORM63893.1 integrating conjugative element protein [Pantoea rodasii]PJZ04192.1 TIGR03759 family integrating conjugative element protein [Pantoea rodasii]
MKLKIASFAAIMLCCSAQASVLVQNSRGDPVDAPAQSVQQSSVQDLKQQSGQWGLSQDDYERYQSLMNGPRGIQSPGLDPLSTLGIEARSQAERCQYAEKWVKEEFARTQKELDFQREVTAAWKRLYPETLAVNMGNAAGIAHDTGGRLALFVKSAGCGQCDARLAAVLADNRPVDIYLVDSQGDDGKLRGWAKDHHIPLDRVRSRQITLNHDGGRWMRFGNGMMPVVLQQGEDGWQLAAF